MPANDYHFVSRWRVEGTVEEVFAAFENPADLAVWWPVVYLRVEVTEPGDDRGIGRTARLVTQGILPYRLRWTLRVTDSRKPYGFALDATGDFNGRGEWTFEQDGRFVNATFDWRVRADKPLVRALSFLLKPLFGWNHRWAMAKGEASLSRELARRRQASTP